MKKITLFTFLIITTTFFGQTYSTGVMNFTTGYSGKIDVTNSLVTLTLVGPSTGWLGISFDSVQMDDIGKDVVLFDGTNLSDRTFDGQGIVPPLDAIQNWTVTSNTVTSGVRTVVGTRARSTGDANDYTFSASAQPLNIVWARKLANFTVSYHGGGSCGVTVSNFTLGNADFNVEAFKLFPNPAKGLTSIELPANINDAQVKIYDNLGRVVRNQSITKSDNNVTTSDLSTGSYLVVVRTDYGNATKTLIIE